MIDFSSSVNALPLQVSEAAPLGAPKEIIIYGQAFHPEAIPADSVVRCGRCSLIDPHRRGHTPEQCITALKDALAAHELASL